MKRILANDGLDKAAVEKLRNSGFEVVTTTIPQEELPVKLNAFDAIVVRSATKLRQPEIDGAPNTKLFIRAGVGIDNIDAKYAEQKGVTVKNTPLASSLSVAELVFAHLFAGVRFIHQSNREMAVNGNGKFKDLKSSFSKGTELRGKTLGIIGFGNIGMEVAKIAWGIGMNVLAMDIVQKKISLPLVLANGMKVEIPMETASKDEVLKNSDFISIHIAGKTEALTKEDFEKLKNGVGIVNCARGGVIREENLLHFLNNGKLSFVGLDVFENEPTPAEAILHHPKISMTPHIGASTSEAQQRIGMEVADIIIRFFKS